MAGIDLGAALREIVSESTRQGVDPYAAIAVAKQEGLGGGVGDSGTSFGPFQLHYGGAYPSSAPHGSQQASQEWAWSTAGIDYAIGQIAAVSRGQTGATAVGSIVNRFERPADPQTEIRKAFSAYQALQGVRPPIVAGGKLAPGGTYAVSTAGTGSASQHAGSGDFSTVGEGISGAAAAVASPVLAPIHSVEDALKFVFSYRFLEIVGGLGLIAIGVAGLVRSQPVTQVVASVVDMNDRRRGGPRSSREGVGGGGSFTLEADRRPAARPVTSGDDEIPF